MFLYVRKSQRTSPQANRNEKLVPNVSFPPAMWHDGQNCTNRSFNTTLVPSIREYELRTPRFTSCLKTTTDRHQSLKAACRRRSKVDYTMHSRATGILSHCARNASVRIRRNREVRNLDIT